MFIDETSLITRKIARTFFRRRWLSIIGAKVSEVELDRGPIISMSALGQSGHVQCKRACPLYPQERTLGGASDPSKQHHYSIIDGGSTELTLQPLLDLHSFR
jgi:hypothetical protein